MRKIILLLVTSLFGIHQYAQTVEETPHFNSDGTVKHAVNLNIGFTAFGMYGVESTGPTISILYQRQFLKQHFLRGGFRFQAPDRYYSGGGHRSYYIDPAEITAPGSYSRTQFSNTYDIYQNYMIGYEIGYAKHFGKMKVQPVLGVSLYLGYQHMKASFMETSWLETKTYDPITESSSFLIEPRTSGVAYHTNHRIFMGVIPRLGLNADLGNRFSLGVSLTPYIGYSHRVGLKEGIKGDKPQTAGLDRSFWDPLANAELNMVFKIVHGNKKSK